MISKATIPKIYSLSKNERLKSYTLITKLFKEGQRFSSFPVRVLFLLSTDLNQPLQAGFTVSSRNFKKAVDRNRIKRLLRESYRKHKLELQELMADKPKQLSLFIIYSGNDMPPFQTIEDGVRDALKKLLMKVKMNL